MKFLNYIKYLFGWTDSLLVASWVIRDDELNELFLEEMYLFEPDLKKCKLISERIDKNHEMYRERINSNGIFGFRKRKAETVIPLSKIKPSDFTMP